MSVDRSTISSHLQWTRSDSLNVSLLILLTVIPYVQVVGFDFVSLDDRQYVTGSNLVKQGLAPWAVWDSFFGFHADNWHPLVWWSLMRWTINCSAIILARFTR